MARKTLKWTGSGGAAGCLLFVVGGPLFVGFYASAAVFDGARTNGGADSTLWAWIGIGGMVVTAAILALVVAAFMGRRRQASYSEVIAGLRDWAARNRWEVTDDVSLAAHWATRFHFSADDMKVPIFAARGWVHGRDALILYYMIGAGDVLHRRTIIVVDADADYPVTAVVRPRSAAAASRFYGTAVPLESVEFERRWRAMGSDSAGSHAVFTPRVIARLLEPMPGDQPQIIWDGPGIRAADNGLIAEPMHLESRLLLLADLAGLTPAYQVTHTNDDPSLLPYVPRRTLRISGWTLVLIPLGVLFFMSASGSYYTASELWAPGAKVGIGLALIILGVRLSKRSQAREASEWHAGQASALGPPPTERQPPAP